MYCKKIGVKNFRNIEDEQVSFCEGVNLISGKNAQGKTNLLEAIFYSSVGKSFRAVHSEEIIRFGCKESQISLDYFDGIRDGNIKIDIFKDKRRRVEKNGVKIDKMSDLVGAFRTVLFCPEHLSLIKEGPSVRRNYLDMAISCLYPLYMKSLQRYNYILKQRNTLIKNANADREAFDATVDIWSQKLASEAAILTRYRAEYVRRANRYVCEIFSDMMGESEKSELSYASGAGVEDLTDTKAVEKRYTELLCSSHEREIFAGATIYGAHKDDIDIYLNAKSARNFASQGQQRSLSLAMKIAECEISHDEFGDYPVMLLDDVLSELDEQRREYLFCRIRSKQVIMTSCEQIGDGYAKRIIAQAGRYTEE